MIRVDELVKIQNPKRPGTFEGDTFCRREIGIEPIVFGYEVLVRAPYVLTETEGGMALSDDYRATMTAIDSLVRVIAMGPEALKGKIFEKDPEPRFMVGDWVQFSFLEKQRLVVNGFLCYYVEDCNFKGRILDQDVETLLGELRV